MLHAWMVGAAILSFLPGDLQHRALQSSQAGIPDNVILPARLTSTQVAACDILVEAVLGGTTGVVLSAAASLGKTTVLAAALDRISDPALQVIQLGEAGTGMDDAYKTLFAPMPRRSQRWKIRERRIILVMDQAEAMQPASIEYLALLNQMPGKDAAIQWIIAGRPASWDRFEGPAARFLREMNTVHVAISPLSKQDAWELFHHRVSPIYDRRFAPKLIAALLQQSEGLPGRFDAALQTAVGIGLLKGARAKAA